ncbi:MAG: hypothetical protein ABI665_19325 [Vicinamibacterales bacterium]
MTTIIKLIVALLITYVVAQVGMAAYKYYQFEDAVHEAVLFAPQATDADIVASITSLAGDQDVPLDASDIQVTRTQNEVKVQMSYEEDVSLIPGLYAKTWTFKPSTSARILIGVGGNAKPRR